MSSTPSRIARLEEQRPQAIEYPRIILTLEDGRELPLFSSEAVDFLGWGERAASDPTAITGIYLAT